MTVGFISSSMGSRVVCLVPLIKSVSVLAAVALQKGKSFDSSNGVCGASYLTDSGICFHDVVSIASS